MKNTIKHYRIISKTHQLIWTKSFVKTKKMVNQILSDFFTQKPWLTSNVPFYSSSQHDKQVVLTIDPENLENLVSLSTESGYSENCIINTAFAWKYAIKLHPDGEHKNVEKFIIVNRLYDIKKLEELIIAKRFSAIDVLKWFIDNHLNEGYSLRNLAKIFNISHQALHQFISNDSRSLNFELNTLRRIQHLLELNKSPRFLKPQLLRLHVAISMAINNIPLKNLLKTFKESHSTGSNSAIISLSSVDFKKLNSILNDEYYGNRLFLLKDALVNFKNVRPVNAIYRFNAKESLEESWSISDEIYTLINSESELFHISNKQYLSNALYWFINQDIFNR